MTNFEKAVEIAVAGIKHDAAVMGVDWKRVGNWAELLEWFGQDSTDMREGIYFELRRAATVEHLDWYPMDDCSVEDSDGSIKTYRQLTNAIRKQLFA